MNTSPMFQEELQAVIEQPFDWLLVDLTDCDYLDSSAIHVLFQAERNLDGRADKLALIIPSPHQRRSSNRFQIGSGDSMGQAAAIRLTKEEP